MRNYLPCAAPLQSGEAVSVQCSRSRFKSIFGRVSANDHNHRLGLSHQQSKVRSPQVLPPIFVQGHTYPIFTGLHRIQQLSTHPVKFISVFSLTSPSRLTPTRSALSFSFNMYRVCLRFFPSNLADYVQAGSLSHSFQNHCQQCARRARKRFLSSTTCQLALEKHGDRRFEHRLMECNTSTFFA